MFNSMAVAEVPYSGLLKSVRLPYEQKSIYSFCFAVRFGVTVRNNLTIKILIIKKLEEKNYLKYTASIENFARDAVVNSEGGDIACKIDDIELITNGAINK